MAMEHQVKKGNALTKRQKQALETKMKIFNAAIEVINEKGFPNTSIEDITSRADVAVGSFYTHFGSKEEVVVYTIRQSDEFYEQAYNASKKLDYIEMLGSFIRLSYTEFEKRGKGIMRAIVSNYFAIPDNVFFDEERTLRKCLTKIVERGMKEGFLDDSKPVKSYVDNLNGVMVGAEVMWCVDDTGASLVKMMEDAIKSMGRGIMKTK